MLTKYRIFNTVSLLSIAMGLVSLLMINISILYDSTFLLNFIPQGIGLVAGIIGIFNKQSKNYGLWGIALNASTFIYIFIIMVLGTTINP